LFLIIIIIINNNNNNICVSVLIFVIKSLPYVCPSL